MVKAEPERNYYADLELEPSATANDVKKQFKKLALLYHPDRNDSEDATAKFQAIQSATEVLTDPQQRAKYDAQRIRSGLLHTYTDAPPPPPRNNASRPPGFSNFPPPPRPHPTTTKKTSFAPPPAGGAQKYARYSTPDAPSWRTRDTDDAKSKTNDFKAWEHMRHGQGPIPRGRKETKPTSFPHERERYDQSKHNVNTTSPKWTAPRRPEWENLPDAGMPNIKRTTTNRMPPRTFTYSPSATGAGGDEPQARSAFFNVSRERPAPSRAHTNMPPPPPPSAARAPTAKKADPLQNFKQSMGANDLGNGGSRVHTKYPTMHGEKTNLSPGPSLHRSTTSATPREKSSSRNGFYDSDSLHANGRNGHHVRSASASSPYRDGRATGMASISTSSSESSSDDEEAVEEDAAAKPSKSAFNRPKQQPKTRRPHVGAGAPQRSFFNPYVTVDEVQDERMVSGAAYSGHRRHSGIDLPTHKRVDDPPDGFQEHRKKHEAARPKYQGASEFTDSNTPHFMQRPKSFDESYRRPTQEEEARPGTANVETTPMYDSGFRWSLDDQSQPFRDMPSLRSQSAENIDVKFSPARTPPKFGGESGFYGKASSGETMDNPIDILDNEELPTETSEQEDGSVPEKAPCPPPPKGPACFYPNDWHQRAWAGTFQAEPARTQSRTSSQRRAGTARASSSTNAKRAGNHRAPELQPSVNDIGDEPPSYSTVAGENVGGSRASSEGSAMDIDPTLTPPSGNDNQYQANSTDVSPTRPVGPKQTPNKGPALPPRTATPVHPEEASLNLGLGDFQNVTPFGPSADGLAGMDDLSQALPFESRASSQRPPTEKTLQNLNMPRPPKAPSPPRPLNPTTFKSYVDAMASYMKNWTNFNNTMLSHFYIQQEAQKQMNPGWMSIQGDGDYNTYLKTLVEDERLRKCWEIACDNHRECIDRLGKVRNDMKEETARAKRFPYPN